MAHPMTMPNAWGAQFYPKTRVADLLCPGLPKLKTDSQSFRRVLCVRETGQTN